MRIVRFAACLLSAALVPAGCFPVRQAAVEPQPLANIQRDARISVADRHVATAIARCYTAAQRRYLRYAAASYEGGDSPVFIVYFAGGQTAVNALNNDLYFDTVHRFVFAAPGEPTVAPDRAERAFIACLARARAVAR
jgi:hypothetical protein